MMMPGLMVLTRAPRLAPADGFGHDPQRVAALGELVGVERVRDLVGLEHRQREQLVGGRGGERVSCSAVRAPRRWPDWEAMTTPAPPAAMTLPNSSSTTAVP